MPGSEGEVIIAFLTACTLIILVLSTFIIWFIYKYQQKQQLYNAEIHLLRITHEKNILQAQIEIQEQTFQNISRDIHDNIGQKLSLAKLRMLNFNTENILANEIITILTDTISDLRDLSGVLSSDRIVSEGFLHAVEFELGQLRKTSRYGISLTVEGEHVFMDAKKDLIMFRIFQESLQNILKHANASNINVIVRYLQKNILIRIIDDGTCIQRNYNTGQGIKNMHARATMLNGNCSVTTNESGGTTVEILIPNDEIR